MGWDVAIWGSLALDARGIVSWKRTVVDGTAYKGWRLWFANAPPGKPRTVQKHLEEWQKASAKGHEHLEVREAPEGLAIEGFVSQGTFVERAQELASLFRVAEQQRARGEVHFIGVGGGEFAYRVRLDGKGKSKLEPEDEEELEMAPQTMAILRKAGSRLPGASKRKAPSKPEPGASTAHAPMPAPGIDAVLADVRRRIAATKPADAWKAAKTLSEEVVIFVDPRPKGVTEAFPTPELLVQGLTNLEGVTGEQAASRHRAAMSLLSKLDPAAAEPLALRMLAADSPADLRWGAAFALVGAKSDVVVEGLLDAFVDAGGKIDPVLGYSSYLRRGAEVALIATGRADVCARLVALLTDERLNVGKSAPAPGDIAGLERWDLLGGIFRVLGKMRGPTAWERASQIAKSHPSRVLREIAAEALLFMADPKAIKAAFGEAPAVFFKKHIVRGHMYPLGTVEIFHRSHAEASARKLIATVNASKKAR